ncbi:S8 family serine peptidase [candidate division KSB1 bacterium]|nr:S8 family serine peptidase [candidate division KSB1 bacterium]
MKIKHIFIFLWFILFIQSVSASRISKTDTHVRLLVQNNQINKMYQMHKFGLVKALATEYTNVLIKTDADKAMLSQFGIDVQARIGDIVSANVAINNISTIVDLPEIRYIQIPKLSKTLLDMSVVETRANFITRDFGSTGEGVLIGIIDTGIDIYHQDFRNTDGSTRIKYLLDFSYPGDLDGDEKLDGPDQYGGTLYTEQDINDAILGTGSVPSNDVVGHGTHVAGIAAGNGRATSNNFPPNQYVGVAPEADLIIVKATRVQGSNSFGSTDYFNALAFIDSIAAVFGKPYVANMSLGGNDGPHDGTLLEEQAIDQLIGAGHPGKAVVIASGNDGDKKIHFSGTFTDAVTSFESRLKIEEYETNSSIYDDFVLFEMWYDGTANHSIKLIAPDETEYGPVTSGSEFSRNTENGGINILNASNGINPYNNDKQAIIQLFDATDDKTPKSGTWKFVITGTSGRFDIWLSGASMSPTPQFSGNVDETMLVANPGTANQPITVGAYVTKASWTDIDGNRLRPDPEPTLNDISIFSSPGPTRDFRTKPEIAAPGEMITSALSTDALPDGEYTIFNTGNENFPNGYIAQDNRHALSQGTSMAAPHVTGVAALMLEEYPNLDAAQIKDALISSARKDQFTQNVPNNYWGYGKMDAFQAMNRIAGITEDSDLVVSFFQNSALTQFLDFYLIAHRPLQSTPTATFKIGSAAPEAVSMAEQDQQIYKGEYEFTDDGSATLTIRATIQGESETTITEYFGITLLKPGKNASYSYDNLRVDFSNANVEKQAFITVIPRENVSHSGELKSIGKVFQIGPAGYQIEEGISLEIGYDLPDFDQNKISIYKQVDNKWHRLASDVDTDRRTVTTSVQTLGTFGIFYDEQSSQNETIPSRFTLFQNYPNPFNGNTTLSFRLSKMQHVNLKIYNIKGELITTLFDGVKQAGIHTLDWHGIDALGNSVASGLYVYKLSTTGFSQSLKMLYLK